KCALPIFFLHELNQRNTMKRSMMKMKKVLVTELMWEDGINDLKQRGYDVYVYMELSRKREELLSLLPDYDAVIVRNESKVDTEFLDAAKKTQVIGRLGVGLDNI